MCTLIFCNNFLTKLTLYSCSSCPSAQAGVNICPRETRTGSRMDRQASLPPQMPALATVQLLLSPMATSLPLLLLSPSSLPIWPWGCALQHPGHPRHAYRIVRPTPQHACYLPCLEAWPITYTHVAQNISSACMHAPSGFLTKHKYKEKIIKNFKTVTAEDKPRSLPPLRVGPCVTAQVSHPESQPCLTGITIHTIPFFFFYSYLVSQLFGVLVVAPGLLSCGTWAPQLWHANSQLWHMGSLVVAFELLVVHACGIQFPDQVSNPGPLHWEHGVLSTVPPGKSQHYSQVFQKPYDILQHHFCSPTL